MPASNVSWPVPLQRLAPWYPGQMGVEGTDSETGLRLNTGGVIFWVDPNHVDTNDSRDGTNPTAPLATVTAALTKCEPYRGDVIAVMHNGMWTYGNQASANVVPIQESVTVTVPGVRIVGVSSSPLGVPWMPAAINTALITVDALDVVIEGFNFWPGLFTGNTGIFAEWDGVTSFGESLVVRHCYFYNLAYGVVMDYTWNCYLEDCRFQSIGTAAIHNTSVNGDPDYLTVRGCEFVENTADINLPTTDLCLIEGNRFLDVTAAITMLEGDHNTIHGNTIEGDPTGTNNMINLTVAPGTSNNLVSDNWLSCTIAQYDVTCSDAGSGSWVNNHCIDGDTTANPI